MNGVLPKQIAHRGKQLFTPQQEKEIVKWIIESDEAGNGRSRMISLNMQSYFTVGQTTG